VLPPRAFYTRAGEARRRLAKANVIGGGEVKMSALDDPDFEGLFA